MAQQQPLKPEEQEIRYGDVIEAPLIQSAESSLLSESVTRQFSQEIPLSSVPYSAYERSGGVGGPGNPITIGEALEATALTAGKKAVDYSDAAAIQAAELRATGLSYIIPGGVGAAAETAAILNASATTEEEKTRLSDILSNATDKLPSDRAATKADAEELRAVELRNDPAVTTHSGRAVSAAVATAARLNNRSAN